MSEAVATLPPNATDPAGLDEVRTYLAGLLAQGRHDDVLDQVMGLLVKLHATTTDQQHRILALLKQLYGRKSERISPDQLDLLLRQAGEVLDVADPQPEPDAADAEAIQEPEPEPEPPPQRRPGRNALPAHLPRVRDERKVAPADRPCPECGVERTCIGHETSEVLDFVPGRFEVHEIVREKLACKPCQEHVCIAPPAEKLVAGGMCGPGLMAHVLTAKYQDHCPLYRMHQIFLRSGVDLAESTLGSWVAAGAVLLLPLAKLVWARAKASPVIGADDTGVRVLDADHEKGIKRGHLWAYLGYDETGKARWPAIRYTPDWSKQGPAEFLAGFAGTLQGDGYKGWMSLATDELKGIVLAGCMAHARRKCVDALEAGSLTAAVAVKIIQKLYRVEAQAREQDLGPADRHALRQAAAVPLMADLRTWLDPHVGRARPKSPLGVAVTYLDNQWPALQVYLSDGRVPIDNNLVENQMRPVGVGRKNWLFCGSDDGAERAAVIYTVLATCKLAGAEPWAYLRGVLPELARRAQGADVEDLLPQEWVARRAGAAATAAAA
jgi:transposase